MRKPAGTCDMNPEVQDPPDAKPDTVSAIRQGVAGATLIVGALTSLTLAIIQWSLQSELKEFVTGNVLPQPKRQLAMMVTFGVAGAAVLGVLAFAIVKRAAARSADSFWMRAFRPRPSRRR